ncbi:MAG: ATP-dependent zinc protease [Gammaproteobacteria bacterium]|nr:ATP-dependent zinc protease [Gammaproteobacteria bacterium]
MFWRKYAARRCRRLTLVMFALLFVASDVAADTNLQVAGWIEQAVLYPAALRLRAKLDSGAESSSLNALKPAFFSRDGARWVSFLLIDDMGKQATIEQPVLRTAHIKRFLGRSQQRPVIRLELCIGDVRKSVEVNLVDRSGLDYQLLVGRNFLKDSLLVHSGATDLLPAGCTAR